MLSSVIITFSPHANQSPSSSTETHFEGGLPSSEFREPARPFRPAECAG
jgi:hypothetical protein